MLQATKRTCPWRVGLGLVILMAAWRPAHADGRATPAPQTQPSATEASLITAWETVQKNHPKTQAFEKIEDGLYRFHTTRFPFEGQLRVLNLAIDEQAFGMPGVPTMGAVEVELVGAPDDFTTKHTHSYSMWEQDNLLYYNARTRLWVPMRQYDYSPQPDQASFNLCRVLNTDSFWLIFLLILLVPVLLLTRKASRQMKSAMAAQDKALSEQERAIKLTERAVQISEDSNQLLRQIRDALVQHPPEGGGDSERMP